MPVEFRISLCLDLVYARWWGTIDLHQVRASFARYLADRNYLPGRAELIDLSGVIRVDIGFEGVKLMLWQVNDQVPGQRVHTKTVFWAPEDEAFATGRMYQQLADYAGGISVEVFREEANALAVLDLPYGCMAELVHDGAFLPAELG